MGEVATQQETELDLHTFLEFGSDAGFMDVSTFQPYSFDERLVPDEDFDGNLPEDNIEFSELVSHPVRVYSLDDFFSDAVDTVSAVEDEQVPLGSKRSRSVSSVSDDDAPFKPKPSSVRKTGRRDRLNYNFDQLTTATRPFIHDLACTFQFDGSYVLKSDLQETRDPTDGPEPLAVETRQKGKIVFNVLSYADREWVLFADACSLLGVSRQFLNYRIMNGYHVVDVLRMNSTTATNMAQVIGDRWAWGKVKKTCHLIMLALSDLVSAKDAYPFSWMEGGEQLDSELIANSNSKAKSTPRKRIKAEASA